MNPEDVKHKRFEQKEVIYNKDDFSIACGIWDGKDPCLAMRWNGAGKSVGYPNYGRYATWFIVSPEFTGIIVEYLLNTQTDKKKEILDFLNSKVA